MLLFSCESDSRIIIVLRGCGYGNLNLGCGYVQNVVVMSVYLSEIKLSTIEPIDH